MKKERVKRELKMKMMKMKYETNLKKMMRKLRERYIIYWINKKKNIIKYKFSSYKWISEMNWLTMMQRYDWIIFILSKLWSWYEEI